MSEPPKVSIGIPVFNGERFLDKTIESILSQTFTDFELVISDNASKDGTEEICRRYADHDPRIAYVRNQENLGAAYNYNQAFHLSSGEYFKWACHDDLLRREFLERCVEVLDRNPAVVLAYTGWAPIDVTGARLDLPKPRYAAWRADAPDPVKRTRFRFRMERRPPSAIYGLFRSSVLRRTGLYRPTHGGDHILMAEIALYGPLREIPEELFLNRWHSASGGKISTYRERVDWWLPESRRHGVGRSRVGKSVVATLALFAKTMAQTAVAQIGSIRRSPLSASDKLICYAQLPLWFGGELWRRFEPRLRANERTFE